MAHIAIIIDDLFEDSEYTEPAKAFKKEGYDITHVGITSGSVVKGKKENTPVTIDRTLDEVAHNDFDALLIPGGYSPDRLRANKKAVQFVKSFMQANKPVFCICHGAQLLITAQELKGRRATGWKSIIQDIKNAGAEFVDAQVVEDGNLITSRQPGDLPAFIDASLKKLQSLTAASR